MKSTQRNIPISVRTVSMILILIGLGVFFRLQVGEFYFGGESIAKLSRDMTTWTILAAGVTLIIISGNIDLSIGSLLGLIAAFTAMLISSEHGLGWSATVAVPLALLVGTVLGFGQGVLTAYFKIPSFIVTLGGLFVFRGLTLTVSAYDPRVPDSSWVTSLGFDYASVSVGWTLGILTCVFIAGRIVYDRLRLRKSGLPPTQSALAFARLGMVCFIVLGFVYKMNEYKGIPVQTLIMIAVLLALHAISKNMKFGRYLYAIGGNVEAARLSGVRVERNVVGAFALMGFLAALAGIVWMAQNQGSTKNGGEFYELYAIAAAVIGGASLMGGRGTIFGTFLGGLVMATVIQGMDYTNLENWMQLVVRGALLVIAVGIDIATKNPTQWMKSIFHSKNT